MNAQNSVIVVTGAGNGMGREVTLELVRRGARVAAVDINPDALAQTVQLAGSDARISTHVVNVADVAQVAALPAAVVAAHGQVDGLINVAGIIHKFKNKKIICTSRFNRIFK